MKITKYVKGGYDYVHHGPSAYDKMMENGELDSMYYGEGSGFWNQPSTPKPEEEEEQQPVEGQEDFVVDFEIPDDPEYIARQERKRMAMEQADEDDYYDRLHGEGEYEGNPHDIYADEELPFGDDPDGPYDPYDEEFEKDRQRDQELLDQYGGAIRIWYAENQLNGKEGSYICPGSDVEQAVREAVNQTASKDPNCFVITQVDVLEGYYDPESGMTPYDGEPVWRSGDTKQSRDMWYEADKALENMCLDTKEGWIKQQAAEYGTNLEAKETIKDIGLSEGRFKNDHEFDVLWNFAINYDGDDDIESATAVTSGTPGWIQSHVQDRKQANEFLSRFDEDFIQDLRSNWQDYIHEMSEYYSLEDDDPRKESGAPNANEWLAGLAESYPDIPIEELDDAWKCIEVLDDDYLAYI